MNRYIPTYNCFIIPDEDRNLRTKQGLPTQIRSDMCRINTTNKCPDCPIKIPKNICDCLNFKSCPYGYQYQ